MNPLKIIIITGYSGSGKSTAAAAFADSGYYCVDNMPVSLLPRFLELPIESDWDTMGLVFVMDLREKSFLSSYQEIFNNLKNRNYNFKILFLEADETVLMRRYSQTRRHHPIKTADFLIDNIIEEKHRLDPLRQQADMVMDTSRYTVHELKETIKELAAGTSFFIPMRIEINSFGFKYGLPSQTDMVMDVRFLPNPHFVPELKEKDGLDARVSDYVLKDSETQKFIEKYWDLLSYLIPLYEKEGKAYLSIAVGCTGGRHRSVTIAEAIARRLIDIGRHVTVKHRDIGNL
jgi:RNase adapter protein RapZ